MSADNTLNKVYISGTIIVMIVAVFFHFFVKNSFQAADIFLIKQAVVVTKSKTEVLNNTPKLKIPILNIDTYVEYVGLTVGGAMDVPKNQNNVALYNRGTQPGEIGSSVIAGHFGEINGQGSVFDNLNKLQVGDKLSYINNQGVMTTFIVKELRVYDQKADATNIFISNDGQAHLNLITCEGVWNKVTKSYPNRLVVFTDKLII